LSDFFHIETAICILLLLIVGQQSYHVGRGVMDQTPRQSRADADRVRLATTTIKAVDQIGLVARDQIGQIADGVVRGADEVAYNLRMLASAIREYSKIASEHVAEFCNKATSVIEDVRDLQARMTAGEPEIVRDEIELKESESTEPPLPEATKTGPANGYHREMAPGQPAWRRG
jgi:hypothetical protein